MSYRVVISGSPRAGKTTFATSTKEALLSIHGTELKVMATDDLIVMYDWSAASDVIATWLECPGPWLMEGVAAIRGLRKWLKSHPTGKPADLVVLFWTAFVPLTPGQSSMAKGCQTVWREIAHELRSRGVLVQTQDETQLDRMLAGFA